MLLDQIVFERQSLPFGVGHDELDIFDAVHHLILALVEISGILEVGSYPIPQRLSLTAVDDLSRSILIKVDAWPGWNAFKLRFKGGIHSRNYKYNKLDRCLALTYSAELLLRNHEDG